MRVLCILALGVAAVGAASRAGAQEGMRYSVAVGPLRIDRLAGTPVVPSVGLHKPTGRRGVVGGRVSLVHDAGFYGLNAVALDLDVGVRSRPARVEWQALVGPWLLLGGDGDGTPYGLVAGQATAGVTWWAQRRFGLLALASGRLKFGTSTERATGSGAIGVVVR
ncbi:MAG: hypothetical protein IT355_04190 [Gemmatimonadaceae bacterium]|nr:hypothetical protein [Gemmatimonadaceae bacterium]